MHSPRPRTNTSPSRARFRAANRTPSMPRKIPPAQSGRNGLALQTRVPTISKLACSKARPTIRSASIARRSTAKCARSAVRSMPLSAKNRFSISISMSTRSMRGSQTAQRSKAATLWVDTVDPGVIAVDWYVDDELVAADYGEQFDLSAFGFAAGTYTVRARAYDEIVTYAGGGSLLDQVRRNLDQLQQEIEWNVEFAGSVALVGDYNLDGVVDDSDLVVWKETYGSTVELAADGNQDGIVGTSDYTLWRDNLGNSAGWTGRFGGNVPEPQVASLAAVIVFALLATDVGRLAARRAVWPPTRRI